MRKERRIHGAVGRLGASIGGAMLHGARAGSGSVARFKTSLETDLPKHAMCRVRGNDYAYANGVEGIWFHCAGHGIGDWLAEGSLCRRYDAAVGAGLGVAKEIMQFVDN